MKKTTKVTIIYDQFGKIVSICRPAKGAKVTILSGDGESALITDIDEDSISNLINNYHIDTSQNILVQN